MRPIVGVPCFPPESAIARGSAGAQRTCHPEKKLEVRLTEARTLLAPAGAHVGISSSLLSGPKFVHRPSMCLG